jgi:predicted secreted protein
MTKNEGSPSGEGDPLSATSDQERRAEQPKSTGKNACATNGKSTPGPSIAYAKPARMGHAARWLFLVMLLGAAGQLLIAAAENKVYTDADKGGQVRLKVGEGFEVRLKANPTTGFMWYIRPKSTPLLKLVSQSQTEAKEPGEGRPIFQIFKFEAKRAGEGVLLLHYVRSWEQPKPDDEQFDLHVTIE